MLPLMQEVIIIGVVSVVEFNYFELCATLKFNAYSIMCIGAGSCVCVCVCVCICMHIYIYIYI